LKFAGSGYKYSTSYRWIVWGAMMLAYLIVHFHRMAIGVVREDLTIAFGISATAFGNLGATYFYAYTVMQLPSGILADTLGARKTVTYGTLLAGCGSILFGLSPSIGWAFAGRLLVGIGVSVVLVATLKILSQWFPENQFATMTGITAFVGSMGGMVAQTPLALMVVIFTWRITFAWIGVAGLVVAAFCYVLIRNTPAELGLPSVAIYPVSASKQAARPAIKTSLGAVIKNPLTWPGFFVFMGAFGAYITMTGVWGYSFLREVYGFSATEAANHLAIMVFAHAIGCVIVGKLSDIMGRRKRPMILFLLVNFFSWIVLIFWNGGMPPVSILPLLFFIQGFSSSAVILGWSCSKDVNDPSVSGIATSFVNTGAFIGAAALPVVLGFVVDSYFDLLSPAALYQRAFLFCAVAAGISLAATLAVKETYCRNIYTDLQQ
jgi:sugar phosphate permease